MHPHVSYLIQRLGQALICILGVSVIIFSITHLIGDPVQLLMPAEASQADRQAYRQAMGLDRSMVEQYFLFLSKAAVGNLGESYRFNMPVLELVLDRFPATIELAVTAIVFAVLLGVGTGIVSAVRPNGLADKFFELLALSGMAAPTFWVGIMLIMLFSVELGWLPSSGRAGLDSLVLPAVTLGWYSTAVISRMTRSAMLETLGADFVRTAVLKGAPARVIIFKHCLRYVLPTLVTIVSLQFVTLLAGAVITETIFAWPGIGRLLIQSAYGGDYPVVQGITLICSVLFVLIQLLADLLQFVLDPRIRQGS
ncbi:MAG: ABC transporter permease [Betaproteobacteria bacterium]